MPAGRLALARLPRKDGGARRRGRRVQSIRAADGCQQNSAPTSGTGLPRFPADAVRRSLKRLRPPVTVRATRGAGRRRGLPLPRARALGREAAVGLVAREAEFARGALQGGTLVESFGFERGDTLRDARRPISFRAAFVLDHVAVND